MWGDILKKISFLLIFILLLIAPIFAKSNNSGSVDAESNNITFQNIYEQYFLNIFTYNKDNNNNINEKQPWRVISQREQSVNSSLALYVPKLHLKGANATIFTPEDYLLSYLSLYDPDIKNQSNNILNAFVSVLMKKPQMAYSLVGLLKVSPCFQGILVAGENIIVDGAELRGAVYCRKELHLNNGSNLISESRQIEEVFNLLYSSPFMSRRKNLLFHATKPLSKRVTVKYQESLKNQEKFKDENNHFKYILDNIDNIDTID